MTAKNASDKLHSNVLIFPAGSEIAFEINNALKYSKFITVFGGSSVLDHSEFVYSNYCSSFPQITDDGFIDFLNNYIEANRIDFIYPALDVVQVFLVDNADRINAKIVSADRNVVDTLRSKERTYAALEGEQFIPKTYEDIASIDCFPVFVKPAIGQGAQGARKVCSVDEIGDIDGMVLCEYLPGAEYTVDCLTNADGKLLYCNLRSRDRIRTGISVRTTRRDIDDDLMFIANRINSKFKFVGAWFFQVKKNSAGEYKLMEISPRIPGTMGLSRNLGVNFPLLTIMIMSGIDVSVVPNDYSILLDRAFISRYEIGYKYKTVYIDFDDVIVCNDKVNMRAIDFLYQCAEKSIDVYLLTRHAKNIKKSLKDYRIAESLFKKIIWIRNGAPKSKYIDGDFPIFIDDSFREREEVRDSLSIPVFDVDMIESLLDWRV
ncbi:ATP-grasp domain-containing protein [Candidatus Saccharibacteria bacterium]|nr:ATP-grasp domain-containing protein [Candidatus Saccharibacteria bacterium]